MFCAMRLYISFSFKCSFKKDFSGCFVPWNLLKERTIIIYIQMTVNILRLGKLSLWIRGTKHEKPYLCFARFLLLKPNSEKKKKKKRPHLMITQSSQNRNRSSNIIFYTIWKPEKPALWCPKVQRPRPYTSHLILRHFPRLFSLDGAGSRQTDPNGYGDPTVGLFWRLNC